MDAVIELPAPYADATATASTQHWRRRVSWTLYEPGELHRNKYAYAWVEVAEREPWKGEPLRVIAQRRLTANGQRSGFTDLATKAIAAELLPIIQRYGFTRLWLETRQAKAYREINAATGNAERLTRETAWWKQKAELAELEADGVLDFRPIVPPPGERLERIENLDSTGRYDQSRKAAEARCMGELVGYMTDTGELLPPDDVLKVA